MVAGKGKKNGNLLWQLLEELLIWNEWNMMGLCMDYSSFWQHSKRQLFKWVLFPSIKVTSIPLQLLTFEGSNESQWTDHPGYGPDKKRADN